MPRRQLKCRLSQIVPEAAAYYHLFKSDNAHLWPTLSLSLPPSPLSCSLGLNASAKLNDNIFDTDSCQLTVCSACHGNLSSLPKCLVRCALSPSPSLSLTYTLSLAHFRRDLTPLSCQFGRVILKTYTKWVKKKEKEVKSILRAAGESADTLYGKIII